MTQKASRLQVLAITLAAVLGLATGPAEAKIDGVTGTHFDLEARADAHIQGSDGNTLLIWGYSVEGSETQYPGPTLIVNQGERINVFLTNRLSVATSIVFPGQNGVTAAGGDQDGVLTREALPGSTVSYSFVASEAGTYMYHSGTRPELQLEMGLMGAIIVRPVGFDPVTNRIAYNHPDTEYDYEYLFFHSEMDHRVHELVEFGQMAVVDNTQWFPYYWFFNGRNAPDTMGAAFSQDLPHQPYNTVPRVHPGDRMLMRVVGAGRDFHPFHHHGNEGVLIARDGRLIARNPATGPDVATSQFTIPSWPGVTFDCLWKPWTGYGLGWDVYPETTPPDPPLAWEDVRFEGVPLPVLLPDVNDLTFGAFYSGSPFLGAMGTLPPGTGGFNANGGIAFMWHSHSEKELTTNDIFPGGMLTMMIVEPPGVEIEQ